MRFLWASGYNIFTKWSIHHLVLCVFLFKEGLPRWLSDKEPICQAVDMGSIPGSGRSPGVGNGNPLQDSCLENPRDMGAWWAAVYGITQSRTRLKWLSSSSSSSKMWRRQWHPTLVLLPGKSHGWRGLVGCSPWGSSESDMTEWLHSHFSLSRIGEGNGNPL